MATPPLSRFGVVLQRIYRREVLDTLPAHLEQANGMAVARLSQLDGVFRVNRADKGVPLVARAFSATRPP